MNKMKKALKEKLDDLAELENKSIKQQLDDLTKLERRYDRENLLIVIPIIALFVFATVLFALLVTS